MKKLKWVILVIYLVFGAYLINSAFSFYELPEIVSNYNSVINLIAGILIIFGGISSFRLRKHENLISL